MWVCVWCLATGCTYMYGAVHGHVHICKITNISRAIERKHKHTPTQTDHNKKRTRTAVCVWD